MIGVIHTPYTDLQGIPIQPVFSEETVGTVEVFPEYQEGLSDLEGFSHILLLYCFHQSKGYRLKCRPFLDDSERGVFATRAPRRPCPIGLSTVTLISINAGVLTIGRPDILDGTPLLDIKPYVHAFDSRENTRSGWVERVQSKGRTVADNRFLTEI